MIPTELFFPDMMVRVDRVSTNNQSELILSLRATSVAAICPNCAQSSNRIHSRYLRQPADLPWVGIPARLVLHVRKFFCTNTTCTRRIFTERLPNLVQPYARRTVRLAHAQQQIGLRLGGLAGSRLAQEVAMPTGRDTLLTLVRRIALPERATPRVVGIDDWARRKGHTYGTICVDLETRRPIDLLPDRSVEHVAQWFRDHPGVEIVSRDRAAWYAEAITKGAPNAIHVVDRWHLLKNVGELALRVLQHHHGVVQCVLVDEGRLLTTSHAPVSAQLTPDSEQSSLSRTQLHAAERRAARLARSSEARLFHQQGWSLHAIAAHTGLDRKTVRKYVRLPELPDPEPRGARTSKLDQYKPYIVERWNAGCRNGMQLLREITAQGFDGQRSIVKSYVTTLRKQQGLAPRSRSVVPGQAARAMRPRRPSLQTLAWLIVRDPETLTAADHDLLAKLPQVHADVAQMIDLVQQFAVLVRQRQPDGLDAWLHAARASGIAALSAFVVSLLSDLAAVRAALSLPWSNGIVEGHVNRLKLLKRQSYGRASFDLLRQRVLAM